MEASINYLAILVASISAFVVGSIWYAPFLFGKIWQAETGLTDDDLKGGMAKTFGGSFVLTLIISYGMAMFFEGDVGLHMGAMYGFMTGFFFVAASIGIIYLYEHKSLKLFLINAGYQILTYTIIGAIIGVWQ